MCFTQIPDIETPLPDLPVEVCHDLGGADVLLLHQLAHLQLGFKANSFKMEPVSWQEASRGPFWQESEECPDFEIEN